MDFKELGSTGWFRCRMVTSLLDLFKFETTESSERENYGSYLKLHELDLWSERVYGLFAISRSCFIQVYQISKKSKETFKILTRTSSLAGKIGDEPSSRFSNMADERVRSSSSSNEKLVLHMSLRAHERLYLYLRPDKPGHDWKTLADFMGFTNQEIQYYACDNNPVETIITVWERRPGSTVMQLLEYLEEMERMDLIQDLKSFIG